MEAGNIESLEIELLLEAVCQRWGYDFHSYARPSIERRTRQFLSQSDCASVSEMIPKVLHDDEFAGRLVRYFSIPVTEFFRDPPVFRAVREQVIPLLRTWPHFKIWLAGCATGDEAYSLAIMLREEGLYDRATLYATDFNAEVLACARKGVYEMAKMQEAAGNYRQAGGQATFSDYYGVRDGAAAMDAALRERIVFSNHNLVSDSAFGEMHLILCRNVLIYFDRELQNRALGLFTESLVHGGFLCLGTKEDLRFTAAVGLYEAVDPKARIYARKFSV